MVRTLIHASSHPFRGDEAAITLRPGTQGAQGAGVYLSEGEADIRASDSCVLNGLRCVFVLECDTNKEWYRSKNSADRKKGRPKTWHTNGANLRVTVTDSVNKDGVTFIYGKGERQ